jgi:arsenate reductase (thioredoxin)
VPAHRVSEEDQVMEAARRRVLILCTGNSCRSQMAQGLVNHLLGAEWQACSAGTEPAAGVHPLAVRVMGEVGIDIAAQRPTHVSARLREHWDLVVTVCDAAHEACPAFPGRCARIHLSFTDPAAARGTEEERLAAFRVVRDAIRDRLLPAISRSAP